MLLGQFYPLRATLLGNLNMNKFFQNLTLFAEISVSINYILIFVR